nr:copia protein [Tanacetum cinerariifolium]
MTNPHSHRHVVPIAVLIRSRLVPLNATRPANTAVPQTKVPHQRPTKHGVTKAHSPIRRPINLRPLPTHSNFHQQVTTIKPTQDKGVIDSGCSRHMTGNISYLCDFEEINGRYVAFDGNLKGDTECIVLSSGFKLPDENHVLLRVPRENIMYNVNLKNIVPSRDLTCLFAKATLDESNLWHRRLGHINFKTINKLVKGSRTTWLFDTDTLTQSMNYQPVVAGNQPNSSTGIQEHFDVDKVGEGNVQQYVLLPLWSTSSKDLQNTDANATFNVKEPESEVYVSPCSSAKTKKHDDKTKREAKGKSHVDTPVPAVEPNSTNNINTFSTAGPFNNVVSLNFDLGGKSSYVDPSQYPNDPDMPALEDITYSDDEEDVGVEADFSNLETNITVSNIPTTRVHKDHPVTQIMCDLSSAPQTRSMTRMVKEQDLPKGKRAIGSKWVFRNKKDKRGIVIRNKAQLVAQGHTQEEGMDYDEVFALVSRIKAIRLFLAYASFMGFVEYQMDVKSAFLYGTIEEEVYVCQPPGFEDHDYPYKVYKVVKALYGLYQAPRAWYETLANYLLENGFHRGKIDQTLFIKKQKGNILMVQVYVDDIFFGSTNKDLCKAFEKLMKDKFQMSSMGELTFFLGLQLKQKQDRIFISQDKYLAKILRKFGVTDGRSASTPIDTEKPLLKDPDGEDVDVHTYRSMIGSLIYLTLSRLDILFAVCACAHFQVTPKALHLHAVKRIFRYLKGKPHLGLWYPKDSPFNLVAYFDSDYAGASLNRNCCKLMCSSAMDSKSDAGLWVTQSSIKLLEWTLHVTNVSKCWLNHRTSNGYQFTMSNPHQELTSPDQTVFGKDSSNSLMAENLPKNVSCIKKFWSSVSLKKTNDVIRLQALVDRRNVIITEDSVRQALRLDDANNIDCLPNEEMFVELARIGYEKPYTKLTFYKNEFSSSMALVVIYLATGGCIQTEGEIAELDVDEDVTLEEVAAEVAKDADDDKAELTELKKVIEVVTTTKLMTKVVTAAATTIIVAPMPKASAARRRKGVVIRDLEETATPSVIDEAYARELEAELNANINWNEVIEQVKRKEKQDNTVMIYQALKRKPQTKAQERKNMVHFKSIVAFLDKGEKELEEEASKQSKRKSETSEEKIAKKHKPDKEVDELKTHLQIVPNDEDDVYTEATPLALKVPVVDYQIHTEHKKPYYKIIRADGTNQLFLSFISLLRNFNREDLEMLWKIV